MYIIRVYIYMYIYRYLNICTECMYIYMYVYIFMYVYTYTHTQLLYIQAARQGTCVYIYIHICIYMYIYIYVSIYIYTYITSIYSGGEAGHVRVLLTDGDYLTIRAYVEFMNMLADEISSELQCVAVCCGVLCLRRVAVCCSVLRCVAVCCAYVECMHMLADEISIELFTRPFSLSLSVPPRCSTKLQGDMTVSTENATPPKSTKSRDSNASVQIQIKPQSRFEFVPRNSEESEFLDLVDFGGRSIFSGKWHKHTDEARNHVGLGLNLSHMRHVSYVVRFSIEKLHTDI